jgi:ABC-type branched-subunit amino acid transport system substrate-binding protein
MRSKALGIVLLLSLTGTACAGDVVRYHNAAVGADGVTILADDAAAVNGAGEVAASVTGGASDAVVTDTTTASTETTAATEGALPATSAGAPPPVTPVSGPAARSSRQAAATSAPSGQAAKGGSGPLPGPNPGGSGASGAAAGPSASGGSSGASSASAPIPGPGGSTVGLTNDTITLGVFYPKSGAYAGLARNAPAVAQAAFDEAGLINGRRVVLKYYDDGTANASTIQVEEKRARNEVFQLLSVVSESNVVLAPLADQHKVPLVVGNIDRKVALPLSYVFAVYPYWAHQATILPGFIKNVLGGGAKKIGVVYEGTSTAIDAKNVFKDKAKELGLNVVFEQPIAQNQSTCANEVSNLQARGVELVFMMNGPLGGICMLRDAKALGYRPAWTGVGPSWGFNVVAQASGGGADGIRMLRVTPTLEAPEGRHYSEIMRKAAPNTGADSDDVLLIFYAMLRSVIEALRRAGPDLTRESLVQTWETKMNGYDSGYLPPPTFGSGNRSGPLVVGVGACCTDGKWTTPQQGWKATF